MKDRKSAVNLINEQLHGNLPRVNKGRQWHYGKVDLRELMDFIYGCEPKSDEEMIK